MFAAFKKGAAWQLRIAVSIAGRCGGAARMWPQAWIRLLTRFLRILEIMDPDETL